MSGISTGIGLISGINSASLINQLIAIESRPVQNLQARVAAIEVQRTAFLELSARILAVQNAVTRFDKLSFFRSFAATSTNESVITASAGESATPGSYTFRVHSLVASHSMISRGFPDADTTPVGGGTLSIEVGHGQVNKSTELSALNGFGGVRPGIINITDRSGASADIDLSTAITVEDVLRAINSTATVKVRASVTSLPGAGATGDRIVIEDLTGETQSNLIIADVGGGFTATDLGLIADVDAPRVDGADLVRLTAASPLSVLNDGNGVYRLFDGPDLEFETSEGDFSVSLTNSLALQLQTDLRALNGGHGVRLGTIRITDRGGRSVEVDLSAARTALDVRETINAATAEGQVSVRVQIVNSFFQVSDDSDALESQAGPLVVEDVTGFTAADLGIAANVEATSIRGRDVYRVETLGDVINAINYAPGNDQRVVARISDDGNAITLVAFGLGNTVTVTAGEDAAGHPSSAARDLGLDGATFVAGSNPFQSRDLIAGLDTVLLQSLNGGSGVAAGEVSFNGTLVDFAGVQTLQDVIDRLNTSDLSITGAGRVAASVNATGNGIVLHADNGGEGTEWWIEDISGSLAADLGIAVGSATEPFLGEAIHSGNLQLQYIARATTLSELNAGRGVQLGTIRITDSTGAMHVVNLSASSPATIGDVIDRINDNMPETIEARINDTGDGIVIVDTAAGTNPLTIEDIEGGRAAADLRIAGTAKAGENLIDGSFEIRIRIDAGDTLNDVVSKLNEAGGDFTASVLNHGGSVNPHSLTLTSSVSGRQGRLSLDASGVDLGFNTLAQASDAVVTVGGAGSTNPLLITSSSNKLDGVVEGVSFDLLAASDEDVTVTVTQDVDEIVDAISTFVSAYNDVQAKIDEATSFNPDTLVRGPLLGDRTVDLIRSRLHSVLTREYEGIPDPFSRLFSVGLSPGTNRRLEFDEGKFREVYAESPALVEQLFSLEDTGFGTGLKETLKGLTQDFDGVLARKDDLLADQEKLLNDQIDRLNVLLGAKRARLEAQFVGLESALAILQGQQSALSTLAQLAGG